MNLKQSAVLTAAGLIAIASYEGYSAKPYRDVGGVVTNGFGNAKINPSRTVSVPQALDDLEKNTAEAQYAVYHCVTESISNETFSAFVSFAYNAGGDAFCKSSMLKLYNQGKKKEACDQMLRWVYVGKVKSQGLLNRRVKEREMCLEGL
jgi:lysozyme